MIEHTMEREYNINTPPPIHKIPFIPPLSTIKSKHHILETWC